MNGLETLQNLVPNLDRNFLVRAAAERDNRTKDVNIKEGQRVVLGKVKYGVTHRCSGRLTLPNKMVAEYAQF